MWSDYVPHFTHLRAKTTGLPFSIGGVHQPGCYPNPSNSQDAVGMDVDELGMVAFVSDGCASSSPLGRNEKSINEVGANIAVLTAGGVARRLLKTQTLTQHPEKFVKSFCERYLKSLWHLACHMAQSRVFGKDRREHILFEFLMSTLIGAVVTEDRFLILGGGDGIVGVNGQTRSLADRSGTYPLNDLVLKIRRGGEPDFGSGLACIQAGRTRDLNQLMLASDGFEKFPGESALHALLLRRPPEDRRGYDARFFKEFRTDVAMGVDGEEFHDDRSLIVIRRIGGRPAHAETNHHA